MMRTLFVKFPRATRRYPIYIGSMSLGLLPALFNKHCLGRRVILLTNPIVWRLHGLEVMSIMTKAGFEVLKIIVPDGERYKSWDQSLRLYQVLLKNHVDCSTTMMVLGGGVLGDLGGYIAATYRRGIPLVQVPTTLLAQVDASIGGKVGIDLPQGKNMVGTFYHPRFVFSTIEVLQTLPDKELKNGLAEIIKYGVISDPDLYGYLENNGFKLLSRDPKILMYVVLRCAEIKTRVVAADERDVNGLRAVLNYGHTLAHALETASRYKKLSHGEAVSMGMLFAAEYSHKIKICSLSVPQRIRQLLNDFGLPIQPPKLSVKNVWSAFLRDKKIKNGEISLILTRDIGHVIVSDNIEKNDIHGFIKNYFMV